MSWAAYVAAAALTLAVQAAAVEPTCPGPATVTVIARNLSGVSPITVTLEGERDGEAVGCAGSGVTAYHETLECAGDGVVRCGRIDGLRPGAWIHRVSLTVPGSAAQQQAQRLVLLGGKRTDVSNTLLWTLYPRTFVVGSDEVLDPDGLQTKLDQAAAYTSTHDGPALVTFSPAMFPGAAAPKRVLLVDPAGSPACGIGQRNHCPPSAILPDPTAGLCFEADRIVVDGLDRDARPGGVILSVGSCARAVMRVTGSDNVLRGLVIEGSRAPAPPNQLDVLAIVGPAALRNRVEEVTVRGATSGDAVTVAENAVGNVIADSEISGAGDKGVKVVDGGAVRIERSCLHDNFDGGVQLTTSSEDATVGGSAIAIENVVQHNVGGGAQHGVIVGVEGKQIETHVATRGNIVRFNGARGISVSNNATANLTADVVTDNYHAGARIRTTLPGDAPTAFVRGSSFVCNYAPGYCVDALGATTGSACRVDADCGRCAGGDEKCRNDADCPTGRACVFDDCSLDFCDPERCGTDTCCAALSVAPGVGFGFDKPCGACTTPAVDLGSADGAGLNAFTLNVNPNATGPGIMAGMNVNAALSVVVPAHGNQWEHCADGCSASDILANDVRLVAGAVAPRSARRRRRERDRRRS